MKIIFTGDLSCSGIFSDRVRLNQEIFDKKLLNKINSVHNVVCNLEGPATTAPNLYRSDYNVRSPENTIKYFTQRNISVFNLAKNHIFDCGEIGFKDTTRKILKYNKGYFGAGNDINEASQPIYLEGEKIRISLIGICHKEGLIASKIKPGIFCDEYDNTIKKTINNAKKNSDWVIVNYHGGEEYTRYPMPSRRKKLFKYLDYGANIIIAHHPHVFQGFEKVNKKLIFYSLGNFVFDIPQHRNKKYTDKSALLKLKFTRNKISFSFIPINIDVKNASISLNYSFSKEIKSLSNFSQYNYNWEKECFRLVCKDDELSRFKNSRLRYFIKKSPLLIIIGNALKIKRILKGKNYRPVLFGALVYYVKNIFFSYNRDNSSRSVKS